MLKAPTRRPLGCLPEPRCPDAAASGRFSMCRHNSRLEALRAERREKATRLLYSASRANIHLLKESSNSYLGEIECQHLLDDCVVIGRQSCGLRIEIRNQDQTGRRRIQAQHAQVGTMLLDDIEGAPNIAGPPATTVRRDRRRSILCAVRHRNLNGQAVMKGDHTVTGGMSLCIHEVPQKELAVMDPIKELKVEAAPEQLLRIIIIEKVVTSHLKKQTQFFRPITDVSFLTAASL